MNFYQLFSLACAVIAAGFLLEGMRAAFRNWKAWSARLRACDAFELRHKELVKAFDEAYVIADMTRMKQIVYQLEKNLEIYRAQTEEK